MRQTRLQSGFFVAPNYRIPAQPTHAEAWIQMPDNGIEHCIVTSLGTERLTFQCFAEHGVFSTGPCVVEVDLPGLRPVVIRGRIERIELGEIYCEATVEVMAVASPDEAVLLDWLGAEVERMARFVRRVA